MRVAGFCSPSGSGKTRLAPSLEGPALYPDDRYAVALAGDTPDATLVPTGCPVFARADGDGLAQFPLAQGARHEYSHEPQV